MVTEDINFLDLACLLKITPGTAYEKFGGAINSSFFDAATIAGSLKQKGLVSFTSNYPGPNMMVISDSGKALLGEADKKAAEPFDSLDGEVLRQMSGGKRVPTELTATLNLRPKDLALRLYKLNKQGFVIYDMKNGGVEVLLTENGFLRVKNPPPLMPVTPAASMGEAGATPQPPQPAQSGTEQMATQETQMEHKRGFMSRYGIILFVLIIVIAMAIAHFIFGLI